MMAIAALALGSAPAAESLLQPTVPNVEVVERILEG